MKIINLTKHTVNIYNEDGLVELLAIPPSGKEARIKTEMKYIGTYLAGKQKVPMYETTILGLPVCVSKDEKESKFPGFTQGTIFIVSGLFRG